MGGKCVKCVDSLHQGLWSCQFSLGPECQPQQVLHPSQGLSALPHADTGTSGSITTHRDFGSHVRTRQWMDKNLAPSSHSFFPTRGSASNSRLVSSIWNDYYPLYCPIASSAFMFSFLALFMCLFLDTVASWRKFEEQNIYILSKCFLLNDLVIAKDKIATFQWDNLVDALLADYAKSTSPPKTQHHGPLAVIHWEGPSITYVILLPKNVSLESVSEEVLDTFK